MLISRPLDPELLRLGLGQGVHYRPDLEDPSAGITAQQADSGVWVASDALSENAVERWRQQARARGRRPVIVAADASTSLAGTCADRDVELRGPLDPGGGRPIDLALLAAAEDAELQAAARPRWQLLGVGLQSQSPAWSSARSVTLIGAGIVNLISAHALVEAGFAVELIDAGADPRDRPDWREQGATAGGENARMFSFTEADNYNEKGDREYADMMSVFEHRAAEGGWLIRCEGTSGPAFRTWLGHFDAVAGWRAKIFADDIYGFNRDSGPLWRHKRERHPALFSDVGYTEGVLRLYSEPAAFQASIARQSRVGALRRVLTTAELARAHPGLAAACDNRAIAGGLEVEGFTLGIHGFADGLIGWLERQGVRFTWRTRALEWVREDDVVRGVRLDDGSVHTADHYVASPGAYGSELLRGARSEGLLAGIAGLWMIMPNLEPRLRHSLKIHREGHVGEDSNVTLAHDGEGREILILGSGYAVIGHQHELDLDCPDVRSCYEALNETVRRFFPRQHALGPGSGWRISRRACIRAFTPTGLGLFEGLQAADGLALLTGGHNTGGFAPSPAIADAVVNTLSGRSCAMQLKYDPRRGVNADDAL